MFNNLTCLLVRSITETLKCLNILIISLAILGSNYYGKDSFDLIAVSGLVLYLLTTATIKFINKNKKVKNMKFFISLGINLIISFFMIKDTPWEYMPYCALYFMGVMVYAVIHYSNKIVDVNGFIKKYLCITMGILSLVYLMQGFKHFQVIKIYLPLYLIMSIIYISQVNILEEYNDCGANLINENRNIRRINIASIIITIMSIFIFTTDLFKKGYGLCGYVIETLIYILIKPVSVVMILLNRAGLFKLMADAYGTSLTAKKVESDSDIIKKAKEELPEVLPAAQKEATITIAKVIGIAIFIIIICIVINVIYKRIKNSQIKIVELEGLDGEERSFIFKKDMSEKQKGKIKRENLKDLHVIRRIYIDVIKTLKSRGIEYQSSYTPNEYSLIIENTEFKSKSIGELANIYNHLRYGNKSISKDDINKAYKIKESL